MFNSQIDKLTEKFTDQTNKFNEINIIYEEMKLKLAQHDPEFGAVTFNGVSDLENMHDQVQHIVGLYMCIDEPRRLPNVINQQI